MTALASFLGRAAAHAATSVTLTLVLPGRLFSRIWLADLVQTNSLGSALWFSRYCMIAPFNLATLLKAPPADAVSGDLGKEALDHVEPGRRGGREVQVEARQHFTAGVQCVA
jgi:hypothetical protein